MFGRTDAHKGIYRLFKAVVDDSIIELPRHLKLAQSPLQPTFDGLGMVLTAFPETSLQHVIRWRVDKDLDHLGDQSLDLVGPLDLDVEEYIVA